MLGPSVIVWPQNPIRLMDDTEPEPEVALLKPGPDFYSKARPGPQDVLLLVEVADSSLEKDQSIKVPMYAQAGIEILWIVNLIEDVVEVYSTPVAGTYAELRRASHGETLPLPFAERISIAVDEIMG
jgi:Uma2 family endonuclease